ncbi:MAG: DinB family protein [Anaerolineales bacterium]
MSRFLDFTPLRQKRITLTELTAGLSLVDLRELTNSMVDAMLAAIAECRDKDVTFLPHDPNARDPYAADSAEANQAWTLGHVIVHATASAEESAFLAAELARGVPNHGRSRYEVPWQSITTIAQCRQRLEESRRMRLASLELWPNEPHLELIHAPYPGAEPVNAVQMFVFGLAHDDDHLGQIREIVWQARNQ